MAKRNKIHRTSCPFELSMDLLGGKWKGMIIFILKDSPQRFTDLKNRLPTISNRMLTLALRQLEEDHLILRQKDTPTSTETYYTLSVMGKLLIPVFLSLRQWGQNYQQFLDN